MLSMSHATRVIEKFGGTRPMADKTEIPASTIQSWKDSGVIPPRRHRSIIEAGRKHAIELTPADFIDWPEDPGEARDGRAA